MCDLSSANSPGTSAEYVGAANALKDAGNLEAADALLTEAAARFPSDESIAIAQAWLTNARQDWLTAVHRWQVFCERFPGNPWGWLGGAIALRTVGRAGKADALLADLAEGLALGRYSRFGPAAVLRLELDVARERGNWLAMRRAAEKLVDAAADPRSLIALAQSCLHLDDLDAADVAAERALEHDPTQIQAILIRVSVATTRGDGEMALARHRDLVRLNPNNIPWSLQLVRLLNQFGEIREAVATLTELHRRHPSDPMVAGFIAQGVNSGLWASMRDFSGITAAASGPANGVRAHSLGDPTRAAREEWRQLVHNAPSDSELLRPVMNDDPDRDMIIASAPRAKAAALVFTGTSDAVSIPLEIFDRYLAASGITAFYLKDFRRLHFSLGIRSLADDYHGTLLALRQRLAMLGIERLCTIGHCAGARPAIRYGVELGADRIVGFEPPTHNPTVNLAQFQPSRRFAVRRLAASVPAEMVDLRVFLEGRSPDREIALFYEEEDAWDRVNALHLDGVPGVTLYPQPGLSNHHLLRRFARRDDFREFISMLVWAPRGSLRPIRLPETRPAGEAATASRGAGRGEACFASVAVPHGAPAGEDKGA